MALLYGLISETGLRTVPPLRADVPARRAPDFAPPLASRARQMTAAQAIHATIGVAIWSRRSRDSERRERPNSQSDVNTGAVRPKSSARWATKSAEAGKRVRPQGLARAAPATS